MRNDGITILCLGITEQVSLTFLQTISGSGKLAFHIDKFNDLPNVKVEFSDALCAGKFE